MRLVLLAAFLCGCLSAETGYDAWLRYQPIREPAVLNQYRKLPAVVVALDSSPAVVSAQAETVRGVSGMLGRTLRTSRQIVDDDMIVLGTFAEVNRFQVATPAENSSDSYWVKATMRDGRRLLIVGGANERGVLYGAFALLRKIALHELIDSLDELSTPYAPIRWLNQWDNLDGTIERGYGGRSIFFENGSVVPDLTRAADYARLLASVGINGCTVNNVNANPRVLSPEFIPQLARIADVFRPWGVQLSISVDLGSPKSIGGLDTFDPLDPRVAAWWKAKVDELYRDIPDLGGFVLKADSEGRVGPSTYGRTHADAANVLAAALAPHHGIVLYRGFVYNHHMNWRDLKNDRARAGWDNFHALDGKFEANAAVQIKYGPIDFQVREPVSPLIGALHNTNETLELQITQEYTGQQRHLCYLVPMWKQILDFDFRLNGQAAPVKQIVSGQQFHRPSSGFVGVANVGRDANWLGYDLAQANLYGFARLAWNPDLSPEQITSEWIRQTFSDDALVLNTVSSLLLRSWTVYEGYTGALGLQTLTDILHSHYQPNVASAEHNGWGQWIRADEKGVGMDRTVATGTGYIGQYPPEVAARYESLETTPDDLLLFLHHVPYTYRLHSGKSVIQYIYDSHYDAAAEAQQFPMFWRSVESRVDPARYQAILEKLEYQAGHAIVWRDSICTWFAKQSGIPDAKGRVGNYPGRIEAEAMQLDGYTVTSIDPPENASGAKGVVCDASHKTCAATTLFHGEAGWYDIDIQYFDLNTGSASFQVYVNDQQVASWRADLWLPAAMPNGDTSVRRRLTNIALRPNDRIRIVGTPEGSDSAGLDYLAIKPAVQ
jgi:alpha-glucuronidase